jgi:general secretion pathway protein C
MFARLAAFVIWSLVAATAVFWVLRFGVRAPQAPAYAMPVDRSAPARSDLARLFGAPTLLAAAAAARPEAASRFRLLGVMAPKSKSAGESASYGFALIAVDGKPAKAFTVGSRLDSGLVLQSVGLRTASLGPAQGARSMLLELPALPAPATGVLPIPGAGMAGFTSARPVPPSPAVPVIGQAPALPGGAAQPPMMQPQPVPPAVNVPTSPNLPAADSVRAQ